MDLLTFAAIIGTISGVGALLVAFYEQWANKERRKGLVAIGVALLVAGVLLSVAAVRGRSSSLSVTRSAEQRDTSASEHPKPPTEDTTRASDSTFRTHPVVAPPESHPPERPYESWLRSEGLTILYDAGRWIDGGCTAGTMALGDFSSGGWATGPEVECRPDRWLAFDTRRLLDSPRFYLGHTYCVNFRNNLGNWGQHGGRQRAPGMNEIGVPAAEGPDVGINIGFRIKQTSQGYELEFTREGISACQS